MNKSKLYIIPLLFLLTIFFVNAYSPANLKHYYSFDETGLLSFTDYQSGSTLFTTSTSFQSSVTGKIGNALQQTSLSSQNYFTNITLSNSFSYNYWIIHPSNPTNTQQYLTFYNSSSQTEIYERRFTTNEFNFYHITPYNFQPAILKSYDSGSNINFVMQSVTYNSTSKILSYYENGVLLNSTNISGKITNTITSMTIGNMIGDTIDELSLYDVTLSSSDILILYNDGFGLDYNQTAQITNITITPICINENTYCSNPVSYYGSISCDYSDTYNCNNGCTNDTGVAVCNNDCSTISNPLSCNILGARNCIDSTTVGVCDDWNLDGCYTYAPSSTCPQGQFCLQSGTYFGSCVNTTQSGTHELYGLNVIPYSTSDVNTSYIDNGASRTISVNTIFSAHTQDFYTTGTYYLSRTCDYTEPVLLSTGYVNVTNYANDSVQVLTSATSSDTIVKLSFTPSSYSEGWITLTDTLGSVNSKYYYQRNYSQKRMCIYDNNLLIIYCDYSTNSFDDLTSVDLEYSFQFATKTYSVKATFNRAVDNVRIIGVQTFLGQNIYQINISQFIDFESTIINNLVITNPTTYNTFTSNTGGTRIVQVENPNCACGDISCSQYEQIYGTAKYNELCLINQTVPIFVQPCIFTTSGNHLVRTYGNNNGVPDYSTYKDYNVFIVGLGLTQEEVENSNPNNNVSGSGLPQYMKYIIVAITILLCIGIFLGIGITTDTIKVSLMVGVVLSLFAVITYTILGWISAWIIVAMIIIGLAIVVLLGTMKSSSQG